MKNLKQKIRAAEKKVQKAQHELGELKRSCDHQFEPLTEKELADEWMSVGAFCPVCKQDFGWRCKTSPDSICHYASEIEDGKLELINGTIITEAEIVAAAPDNYRDSNELPSQVYWESCVFCGHPEERK